MTEKQIEKFTKNRNQHYVNQIVDIVLTRVLEVKPNCNKFSLIFTKPVTVNTNGLIATMNKLIVNKHNKKKKLQLGMHIFGTTVESVDLHKLTYLDIMNVYDRIRDNNYTIQ